MVGPPEELGRWILSIHQNEGVCFQVEAIPLWVRPKRRLAFAKWFVDALAATLYRSTRRSSRCVLISELNRQRIQCQKARQVREARRVNCDSLLKFEASPDDSDHATSHLIAVLRLIDGRSTNLRALEQDPSLYSDHTRALQRFKYLSLQTQGSETVLSLV